jgi:NAD(P)-dependent dehydrogenase (short-subunit alcohol dehydrogenase family)
VVAGGDPVTDPAVDQPSGDSTAGNTSAGDSPAADSTAGEGAVGNATAGDRVAVVTGGNRGIGRAIAVALARDGFVVAVTARHTATLADTVDAVEAVGGVAWALPCDVRDEESVAGMARQVAELGPLHTVVANAGIAGPTAPLHEISLEQWRDCVATDLDGVFLTFRAFVPALIAARAGCLIAISSITGKRPLHGRSPYAAAKMGVIGLVRTLADELGPYGVRVNTVCPGAVAGPRLDDVLRAQAAARGITEEEAASSFTAASPLRRFVEADEIAGACAYLASDRAAAITGEDLNVSAGVVMY